MELRASVAIDAGRLKSFKAQADAIVARATAAIDRSDWFVNEARGTCVAMIAGAEAAAVEIAAALAGLDSYAGAEGMFAHMRNCHDVHEALIGHATMVTEFLGDLPEDAMAAVARYDPYILSLHTGLTLSRRGTLHIDGGATDPAAINLQHRRSIARAMFLRTTLAIVTAMLSVATPVEAAAADDAGPKPSYSWVQSDSIVQDRDFYLLTLLDRVPQYRAALAASPALTAIRTARRQRIAAALAACPDTAACRVEAMLWRDDEIGAIGDALAGADGLGTLARRHLRPSGAFILHADQSDAAMIRAAWADAALAMNRILRLYGLGEAPLYPRIDAIDFAPADTNFARIVAEAVEVLRLAIIDDDAGIFSIGPSISWAFLDLDRVRARIAQADARRDEDLARYEIAVRGALEDAEAGLTRYLRARETVAAREHSLRAATAAAVLVEQRRREGTASQVDTLGARRIVLMTDTKLRIAETDLAAAYVALSKSLGLAWPPAPLDADGQR